VKHSSADDRPQTITQSIARHFAEGIYVFIEAKVRHAAEGTLFGVDFEWLLENGPRYRGQIDRL